MNKFCPFCEQETTLSKVIETEDMIIRGEIIPVERTFNRCENCGEEFELASNGYDPYDIAYREYRRRKGWVQPEEIKEFREKFGFTQQELSEILGIGIATLNRYENGALQTESINSLIALCMADPQNIFRLINAKQNSTSVLNSQSINKKLLDLKKDLAKSFTSNESYKKFLQDVGFETDSGQLDERIFSGYIKNNLLSVDQCVNRGDYEQALSFISPLGEVLKSHQERGPVFLLLSYLVRNHEQLIIHTQNLNHEFLVEEGKAAKIRAAILSVNNLVLSSETEIDTDLFNKRNENREFVLRSEINKIDD